MAETPGCAGSEQSVYEPPPNEGLPAEPPPNPSSTYQLAVPGAGFGIFDLVDLAFVLAAGGHHHLVRRHERMARAVAEPEEIAVAEHDVIHPRAAVDRLMIVVAHRELIGEALEIRRIAVLHVVEAERLGTLARGRRAGRVVGC